MTSHKKNDFIMLMPTLQGETPKIRYVSEDHLRNQPKNILALISMIERELRAVGVQEENLLRPHKKDPGHIILWCNDLKSAIAQNEQLRSNGQLKSQVAFARAYFAELLVATLKMRNTKDPVALATEWADRLDKMGGDTPVEFTRAYIGQLLSRFLQTDSNNVPALVGLLERKAERLEANHLGQLLTLAGKRSDEVDNSMLVRLIKQKFLKENNTLDNGHKRALRKLGIDLKLFERS